MGGEAAQRMDKEELRSSEEKGRARRGSPFDNQGWVGAGSFRPHSPRLGPAGPGQVPKAQSGKIGVKATARAPLSSRTDDRKRHPSRWSAIAGQASASTSRTVGRWPAPGEQLPTRLNRNEEE